MNPSILHILTTLKADPNRMGFYSLACVSVMHKHHRERTKDEMVKQYSFNLSH